MIGWLTGLPTKLWLYGAIALAVVGALLGFKGMSERAGALKEREKQRRKADEARKKMDDVPDATSDDVSDSLSKHDF